MKIMSYHKKVRIAADLWDKTITVGNTDPALERALGGMDLPPVYIVEVQVKVLWFWVSIWRKSCEFSDGDSREHINRRAQEVYNAIID